jgi:hypothetical protein
MANGSLEQIKWLRIQQTEFLSAFQATQWLAQFFARPEMIAPSSSEEWLHRYHALEVFLYEALRHSMVGRTRFERKDLQALENVLERLLPIECWQVYRADIRLLRKQRRPLDLPTVAGRGRSAGRRESEQTVRMRAAVECISQKSNAPYSDLAEFWNHRMDRKRYKGDEIRNRLRKGHDFGYQALQHWRSIYDRDFRAVFPSPFPLHPKLAKRISPNTPTPAIFA